MIARTPSRQPKNLWTDAGDGAQIVGYVADNEHDEAAFVAERDRPARRRRRASSPSDVAVFYRTNAQSRVFEEVFVRVGLPYKVVGGMRFYERTEVKDALAYLRVLANPADTVNLRRILNMPKRGHRRPGRGRASRRSPSASGSRSSRRCGRRRGRAGHRHPLARPRSQGFTALLEELRALVEAGAGPGRRCSRRSSSRPATSPSCGPATTRRTRPGSRTSPSSSRWPASSRTRRARRAALDDFLEQVSLVADADQIPDGDEAEDAGVVTLMTLHTAKGLEFPVVFLTGMEDGVFPHLRALGDPKELEEERRLAYVGITRARERLLPVPGRGARPRGARRSTTRPSRFLDEIPAELVDWQRAEAATGHAAARRTPAVATPGRRGRACARPATGRSSRCTPATGSPTTRSAWARRRDRGRGRQDAGARRLRRRHRGQAAPAALRPAREALGTGTAPVARRVRSRQARLAGAALRAGRGRQPRQRVDRAAAARVDLQVQVRAGRVAGVAGRSRRGLPGATFWPTCASTWSCGRTRHGAVPVPDLDLVAVAALPPAKVTVPVDMAREPACRPACAKSSPACRRPQRRPKPEVKTAAPDGHEPLLAGLALGLGLLAGSGRGGLLAGERLGAAGRARPRAGPPSARRGGRTCTCAELVRPRLVGLGEPRSSWAAALAERVAGARPK